jgi:hypothetical protein
VGSKSSTLKTMVFRMRTTVLVNTIRVEHKSTPYASRTTDLARFAGDATPGALR